MGKTYTRTRNQGRPWRPSRFVMDAIQAALVAAKYGGNGGRRPIGFGTGGKRPSGGTEVGYESKRRKRRLSYNQGDLEGKIRRVRKVSKKYWKRYSKAKQGEPNAMIKHCREQVGTVTDGKCVWLTHTTFNAQDAMWTLCAAFLRCCLKQEGVDITSWTDVNNGLISSIVLESFNTMTNAYALQDLVVIGGTSTYDQIVTTMRATMYTMDEHLRPNRLLYKNSANIYFGQIALQGARVTFYSKGSLKMQNQSVVTAGDDEQDVNNVPLYGKTYEFRGSVLQTKAYTNVLYLPFNSSVLAQGASVATVLQEPLLPSSLVGCFGTGKISINPGRIKTSVITKRFNMAIGEFYQKIKDREVNNSYHVKSRAIALEKVLGVGVNNIQIAYEHDLKMYLTLKLDRNETPQYNAV